MKKTILQVATISSLLVGISACASQRPVLSSNAHLMRVGPDVGERDIDECIARAEAASTEGRATSNENVVAGTATSSVVGAAAGGAGGAIVGQAGQGAAAGAVGGVVASLCMRFCRGCSALSRQIYPIGNSSTAASAKKATSQLGGNNCPDRDRVLAVSDQLS